jgi:hypothetical protein
MSCSKIGGIQTRVNTQDNLPSCWNSNPFEKTSQLTREKEKVMLTYPMHAGPIRINAVPPNAEVARKTMNDARLGASAVAKLSRKNMADDDKAT